MKTYQFSIQLALILAACCCVRGQGFIYDQQSTTTDSGGQSGAVNFHTADSIGQSFVPSLSSVGFIRLSLADLGGAGATVYVNLWAGSIDTGTLLGSTGPIFLPAGYNNPVDFNFTGAVSVTSGSTYFFQPVVQTGSDLLNLGITSGTYPNGTVYFQGVANSNIDLWFREGITVPEPSVSLLGLTGSVALYFYRRKNQ